MDKPDTALLDAVAEALRKGPMNDFSFAARLSAAQAALAVIQPRLDVLEAENARLKASNVNP